jgi:hypothetical protein
MEKAMTETKWYKVSKKTPCRVCGKTDWCTFTVDGAAACMRVASPVQMRNGGYLHKADASPEAIRQSLMAPMPVQKPTVDSSAIMRRWLSATTDADRKEYAVKLGVDVCAIEALGAAYALQHNAWAWPMHDGDGLVCGIRLRSDDRKWAVTGSKAGLFIPNFEPAKGAEAVICEGPTDAAAALTLGYYAIGRPSCMGGIDLVRNTLSRLGIRRVIVMSDNDSAKIRPDGTRWYPGQEGARQLAKELKMPNIIIQPSAKDIRAWLRAGAERGDVEFLVKQQMFKKG